MYQISNFFVVLFVSFFLHYNITEFSHYLKISNLSIIYFWNLKKLSCAMQENT